MEYAVHQQMNESSNEPEVIGPYSASDGQEVRRPKKKKKSKKPSKKYYDEEDSGEPKKKKKHRKKSKRQESNDERNNKLPSSLLDESVGGYDDPMRDSLKPPARPKDGDGSANFQDTLNVQKFSTNQPESAGFDVSFSAFSGVRQPTYHPPPPVAGDDNANWESGEGLRFPDEQDVSVITPLTAFDDTTPNLREDVEAPYEPVATSFSAGSPGTTTAPGAQWQSMADYARLTKPDPGNRRSSKPPPRLKKNARQAVIDENGRVSVPSSLVSISDISDKNEKLKNGPLSLFPVDENYEGGSTSREKSDHRLSYSSTGESYSLLDTENGRAQGGTAAYVAKKRTTAKQKQKQDGPAYFSSGEKYTADNIVDEPSPPDLELSQGSLQDRTGAFAVTRQGSGNQSMSGVASSTRQESSSMGHMDVPEARAHISQLGYDPQDSFRSTDIAGLGETVKAKPWYRSTWFKATAGLVLVLAIACAIAVPLVLTGDDGGNSGSPFSQEEVGARTEQLQSILTRLSNETQLEDVSSPQYAALTWMASQDVLTPLGDSMTPREEEILLQRYSLAVLFYSTAGEDWFSAEGWLNGESKECAWQHVECINGDVVSIDMGQRNNLVGRLPSELKEMPELRSLNLPDNGISGFAPGFSGVENLVEMDLSRNNFVGPIPSDLYDLTSLRRLILRENGLTGTLAPSFSKLSGLTELDLDLNKLEGTLTTEFRPFSELTNLNLSNNGFRGNFNFVFQGLNQLVVLLLVDNSFTGSISPDIQLFSNLENLDLATNEFEGSTLATEVGTLTSLQSLLMEDLGLIGTIPTELGRLSELERLYLDSNLLSGPIPTQICALSNLKEFHFDCRNECQCQEPCGECA